MHLQLVLYPKPSLSWTWDKRPGQKKKEKKAKNTEKETAGNATEAWVFKTIIVTTAAKKGLDHIKDHKGAIPDKRLTLNISLVRL